MQQHGADRISDFIIGEDHIRLELAGTGSAADFGDLTLTAQGSDTAIATGSGTITLTGVAPDDLSASDFLFALARKPGPERSYRL